MSLLTQGPLPMTAPLVLNPLMARMVEAAGFPAGYLGEPTPHTTAAEAHENLMLCLAMDRSADKGVAIHLPIEPKDLEALR